MEKEFENRVNSLITKAASCEEEDSFKGYKASPILKEIVKVLEENASEEKETLEFEYQAYSFIVDTYRRMGRYVQSSLYGKRRLEIARIVYELYNDVLYEIPDVLKTTLRDRNLYEIDSAPDVIEIVQGIGMISDEDIKKIQDSVLRYRSGMKRDIVETTQAYLDVIDDVERRVDENMTYRGMGSCHEEWALKEQYLLEYGIIWKSPAILNPKFRFD